MAIEITQGLIRAGFTLRAMKRQRGKQVKKSLQLHGEWAKLRRQKADKAKVAAAFHEWKVCVGALQTLTTKINAYSNYVNKGATEATLNIATGISQWEGGRSSDGLFHVYWDSAGQVWTQGFGHTEGLNGHEAPLTLTEATTLLLHDLNTKYAPFVHNALAGYGWKVNQKMFDALVSFCYNLGPGLFEPSHDIGSAMQRRSAGATANAIMLYDKAGGVFMQGLYNRRHWEKQLFLGGTYTVTN